MNKIILSLNFLLLVLPSAVWACVNLSGGYGTNQNYIHIEQKGCDSFRISFPTTAMHGESTDLMFSIPDGNAEFIPGKTLVQKKSYVAGGYSQDGGTGIITGDGGGYRDVNYELVYKTTFKDDVLIIYYQMFYKTGGNKPAYKDGLAFYLDAHQNLVIQKYPYSGHVISRNSGNPYNTYVNIDFMPGGRKDLPWDISFFRGW